jgi:hypothetical protein
MIGRARSAHIVAGVLRGVWRTLAVPEGQRACRKPSISVIVPTFMFLLAFSALVFDVQGTPTEAARQKGRLSELQRRRARIPLPPRPTAQTGRIAKDSANHNRGSFCGPFTQRFLVRFAD